MKLNNIMRIYIEKAGEDYKALEKMDLQCFDSVEIVDWDPSLGRKPVVLHLSPENLATIISFKSELIHLKNDMVSIEIKKGTPIKLANNSEFKNLTFRGENLTIQGENIIFRECQFQTLWFFQILVTKCVSNPLRKYCDY